MSKRPNIVLFMPDQLRADALGCFGNEVARTPNIDALAARGVRFENAFCQHPVCSPSRASIMTGWYPHVMGHRTLTHLLKPHEPNMLRLLKEAGYRVHWVGQRGDTFAPGVVEQSTDHYGFTVPPKLLFEFSNEPREDRHARVFYHGKRTGNGGDPVLDFDEATVQAAEAFLADPPEEPWLLFVALIFPHPPFEVEEPWYSLHERDAVPLPAEAQGGPKPAFMEAIRNRYGTDRLDEGDWRELIATYYGMVARIDDQLGRVMRALDSAGAAENTLTAFFTDHGEYLGDYGLVEKWPSGLDPSLTRNPLILAGPGVAEGGVAGAMAELVDLLPTFLESADADESHSHFGKSLWPVLQDPGAAHKEHAYSEGGYAAHENHLTEEAAFPYDLKAALQAEDTALYCGKAVSIRSPDWAYVHRLYDTCELYNRKADPAETTNLIGQPEHAAVERDLRATLLDWLFETADVIPWEKDPRF